VSNTLQTRTQRTFHSVCQENPLH